MRFMSVVLIALLALPLIANAQQRPDVFADPKNLEVLPDDISSAELGATMRGIAMGVGLRCNDCHVGEPNAPLHTYDFASDEKSMKLKARLMLEMTNEINTKQVASLDSIDPATRVDVRCITCHRGRPQPKLIEDILDEQLARNGADAAVAKYRELREQFHGSHSYDFSEFTLPMYAESVFKRGLVTEAAALAELNTEFFPDSYYSFFILAEAQAVNGDVSGARASFERAAEINPQAKQFVESRIAALPAE